MDITGIIAEYNPLHKGHAFQIRKIREETRTEGILVVMSGNFVQRGEPALVDKYRRCKMALEAGADAVLELPPAFACGSAEGFARGAVALLEACGCVHTVAFGASCTDPVRLEQLALLSQEARNSPEMQRRLRGGLSYAAALRETLREMDPEREGLLADPNTLLGIEYIRAIRQGGYALEILPIKREGALYWETQLPAQGFASASGIRRILEQEKDPERIREMVPPGVVEELAYQIFPDDFSSMISAVLLRETQGERGHLAAYGDVSPELEERIRACRPFEESFSGLVRRLGSRNFPEARVRRALLHILLGIRREEQERPPRSLKLLGIRQDSKLPALLKKTARLPLITKTADAREDLAEEYLGPQQIYNQAVYYKTGRRLPDDYHQSPLVLRCENDCILIPDMIK
ncbi:MAG: nucleotidyltransferase family protein [Lachnospiraceae bacterium]|nr:nucleotidyltransferase family protein [Lachnospiraceae bacterium]